MLSWWVNNFLIFFIFRQTYLIYIYLICRKFFPNLIIAIQIFNEEFPENGSIWKWACYGIDTAWSQTSVWESLLYDDNSDFLFHVFSGQIQIIFAISHLDFQPTFVYLFYSSYSLWEGALIFGEVSVLRT